MDAEIPNNAASMYNLRPCNDKRHLMYLTQCMSWSNCHPPKATGTGHHLVCVNRTCGHKRQYPSICNKNKPWNAVTIGVMIAIMLALYVPVAASVQCNVLSDVTWHDTPRTISVNWLLDSVCASSQECHGTVSMPTSGAAAFPQQLCPIEIQLGDSIQIIPFVFAAYPANVTEDVFLSCPTTDATTVAQQSLVPQPTNDIIPIVSSALGVGSHYLAQLPSMSSFFARCDFGLRLNVTVKPSDCRNLDDPSMQDCAGFGECVTQPTEGVFYCKCTDSFLGYRCEEFDGCFESPCRNGAECLDVVGGVDNRDYECTCTAGFTGRYIIRGRLHGRSKFKSVLQTMHAHLECNTYCITF